VNESHPTDGGKVDHDNRNQHNTAHFLHSVSESLDHSVETMDASTQARLRAVRREALAASEARSRPAWLMPVGSLAVAATVAVLTVSLWLVPPDTAVDAQLPAPEDIALLSDSEALEFYENLDFYLWLDEENKAG
jgi:negative regulator of sigma E activity